MKKYFNVNNITQVCLVTFTMLGFLFTSFKLPQYGVLFNLISQGFWIRSSYIAWKKADQIGIFVNTIIVLFIIIAGVINYWFI